MTVAVMKDEIDPVLLDDDPGKAYVVEVKRMLAKPLKKDEKIKLYTKLFFNPKTVFNHFIHYLVSLFFSDYILLY